MKYAIGIPVICLGLACVVLCLVLRSQFQTLASLPAAPNLDDYPLLVLFMPDMENPDGVAKPAEFASKTMQRINLVGGVGFVVVLVGIAILTLVRGGRGGGIKSPDRIDSAK